MTKTSNTMSLLGVEVEPFDGKGGIRPWRLLGDGEEGKDLSHVPTMHREYTIQGENCFCLL